MTSLILVRQLQVQKGKHRICFVPELEIKVGERVVVTGGNGSGKTTLLRVLAGLEKEFQGICENPLPARDRIYIHQNPYLFQGTVEFNVCYGLKCQGLSRKEREHLSHHWMGVFGVRGLAHRQSSTLSGGERRRVSLARAFVLKPKLLLLDEPFAELDEDGFACVSHALEITPVTVVIASPMSFPVSIPIRSFALAPAR